LPLLIPDGSHRRADGYPNRNPNGEIVHRRSNSDPEHQTGAYAEGDATTLPLPRWLVTCVGHACILLPLPFDPPLTCRGLTVCVTCVWAGGDSAWEQGRLEAGKMPENAADSHTSGGRFVRRRHLFCATFRLSDTRIIADELQRISLWVREV
jgi:hypothetical protein